MMAKNISGGKGFRSVGRLGKARNMRLSARLLIVFGLLLAFANTAYAGHWKKQNYSKSKIELRLVWPWTIPERGSYAEAWSKDYSEHSYSAFWTSDKYRIQIVLDRLPSGHYWMPFGEIDEKWLNIWTYLKKVGASELKTIPCAVDHCRTFMVEDRECVGFQYVIGLRGSRLDATTGLDAVKGFYCPAAPEKGTDKLDEILKSIVIKK